MQHNYNILIDDYKKMRRYYLTRSSITNKLIDLALRFGDEIGTELALWLEERTNLVAIRACLISARNKMYGGGK